MPVRIPAHRSASLACLALVLVAAFSSHAGAQCSPVSCTGSFVHLDFEGLTPGTPVEGLGAVHPDLAITSVAWSFGPTCTLGSAAAIEEGVAVPFAAYGTAGSFPNGCLNGIRGFGDSQGCVLDYDFTFAPGVTLSCFGIRMLDFGDLFPFGGTTHTVTVTAYDAGNVQIAQDQLVMLGGVDLLAGDACDAQASDPGNHFFTVAGTGIVKVTLRFDAVPDPNVGFDDIVFCETGDPTPAHRKTWGALKTLYRD